MGATNPLDQMLGTIFMFLQTFFSFFLDFGRQILAAFLF